MSTLLPMPAYWPNIEDKVPPEVSQTFRLLYNGINNHDQAIVNLNTKVVANAAAATTTTNTTTNNVTTGTVLGAVNNQTGTSYLLMATDSGGIVTLSNASPVAVTLNSGLGSPFVCSIENLGAGLATLTPSSGTVNNQASITLGTNQGCFLFFSGVNWFAFTSPQAALTLASVAHQFVTAYNAATGAFTTAQPAIADVSGLSAALALLAPIASPTFTGTVTQPAPPVVTAATTATSATAGTATALPALPAGYVEQEINGTVYKLAYYAV